MDNKKEFKGKSQENILAFAKMLSESDEPECMRFMSYIVLRLEYLHGIEHLKLSGFQPN